MTNCFPHWRMYVTASGNCTTPTSHAIASKGSPTSLIWLASIASIRSTTSSLSTRVQQGNERLPRKNGIWIKNVWFSLRFPILFVKSRFRPKFVSEGILGPNLPQLGSSKVVKSAPRAAKRPSRGAQERPRAAQERPKSGQERPKSGPRAAQEQPRAAMSDPRAAKRGPRASQNCEDGLKSGQEGPKTAPDPPKGAPRPPRPPPRPPQMRPKRLQDRSTSVKFAPRAAQERPRKPQEFPNNFRYHRVPHLYNCLAQPEHRTSLRGGGGVARSAF